MPSDPGLRARHPRNPDKPKPHHPKRQLRRERAAERQLVSSQYSLQQRFERAVAMGGTQCKEAKRYAKRILDGAASS